MFSDNEKSSSLEIKFEKLIVDVSSLEHYFIIIGIMIYNHMLLKVPV